MTQEELEKLYTDAYKAVYWTAFKLLKNNEEAEDVVQDTFITAYNSYDSLNDKSKAVAWVKKIAANKCLNILTRTRTVNVEDEILENTEAVPEDFLPASIVESDEKRKIIMDIIDSNLSEDSKMTIVLFYFNEMSIKEIAERLDIPQGTVLSRLNYAKKKIKKGVEDYEKESNDKLFMGVPFLTLLFQKEAEQVPFKPIPASIKNISSSSHTTGGASKTGGAAKGSSGAGKAASEAASASGKAGASLATAAGKGAKAFIVKKIAIGLVAVVAVGGGGAAVYTIVSKNDKPRNRVEETTDDDEEETTVESSSEETYETTEPSETVRNINGRTPESLDLHGGYVRNSHYVDYIHDETNDLDCVYYDADGNEVLNCGYGDDGYQNHSDYYEYDSQGRVIREENWDRSEDNNGTFRDYQYGPNGITRIDYGTLGHDADNYIAYDYNDQGRLICRSRHSVSNDTCWWRYEYEYYEDGSYIERYHSFDMMQQKIVDTGDYRLFSSDGILLEEYDFQSLAMYSSHYYYTYNADNDLIQTDVYEGSSLNRTITYEYDSEGRLVREYAVLSSGADMYEITYDYEDL